MSSPNREYSQFLIIDDDPGIAKFLVTYLRQRGHTCHALTDGFQTASWLADHDCEVAIVDLKMPKVDGISLISFMREMNPALRRSSSLPALAMTRNKCTPLCMRVQTVTSAKIFRSNNFTVFLPAFSQRVSNANARLQLAQPRQSWPAQLNHAFRAALENSTQTFRRNACRTASIDRFHFE